MNTPIILNHVRVGQLVAVEHGHSILSFTDRTDAQRFITTQPARSQRRMMPLRVGAYGGRWMVEWRRSGGGFSVLTIDGFVSQWDLRP